MPTADAHQCGYFRIALRKQACTDPHATCSDVVPGGRLLWCVPDARSASQSGGDGRAGYCLPDARGVTTPDLVELQNRHAEAVNRRDLDAMMAFYAPDAVYDMAPLGMGTFEGQAAARGFIEDWWGAYEEYKFEVKETLDLGNGVGFRVLIQKGRPVGSSGEVQLRYAAVGVWEDGKIVRMTNYTDIDEARAAAERLAQDRADA